MGGSAILEDNSGCMDSLPPPDALPCPGMRISPMQGTDRLLKILVSAVLLPVCRLEGTQC